MREKLQIRIDYSFVEQLALQRSLHFDIETIIELSKLMSVIISVQLVDNRGVLGIDWAFEEAYKELFGVDMDI
jgi:hypothetical protein